MEESRRGKCKYILVKHINKEDDKKRVTFFLNRSPVMYCEEYLTNRALTYLFDLCNEYKFSLIINQSTRNDSTRSS